MTDERAVGGLILVTVDDGNVDLTIGISAQVVVTLNRSAAFDLVQKVLTCIHEIDRQRGADHER